MRDGKPTRLLVATGNPHKVEEIAAIWHSLPGGERVTLLTLRQVGLSIPEPVEDGATFADNALLKARYYAQAGGMWTLADDSGLEVDALNGAPGVYSARYAGVEGPRTVVDLENNRKLLRELANVPIPRRTARFVCTMALVPPEALHTGGVQSPPAPSIEPIIVRGTVEGRMLLPEECANPAEPWRGRGGNGFGYDPLFWHPASGCTTAQLPPEAKNAISHRGQAARLMWERVRPLLAHA